MPARLSTCGHMLLRANMIFLGQERYADAHFQTRSILIWVDIAQLYLHTPEFSRGRGSNQHD